MRKAAFSCDSHVHVVGDPRIFPPAERPDYTPRAASLDSCRRVMAQCGIRRAVLVQPSVYARTTGCFAKP
jgi:predicted TIM-barrel fold metal-dependent hydrolase